MAMTHTAEEVRTLRVKLKSGDYDGVDLMHAWIALDAYAALLERSEAEVTNSVVNAALKEFRRWADSEDTVAMDAALHLVWPMPLSGRAEAKLSERKTVHEWLDDLHIEREEFGKPLCLLRRLRILCDRYRETCDQLSLELGKQIGWPVAAEPAKAGVTDFVRDCAITAFNLHPGPGEPLNVKEHGESMRAALLAVWPVAAEPAQEVPVAYLAKNANEAFLFFADDHEGLDAYTADGFSITPLVRHSTPEASCGDCPTRDYKAAEPARPADSGRVGDENGAATLRRLGDNAAKWAAEFRATALRLGYSDMDEGWLIGWFANAIEHSSDIRRWRTEAALAAQGQPAEPVVQAKPKTLALFTANQAQALLDAFGGSATTYALIDCKVGECAPLDDGAPSPDGLYIYDINCPEEGVIYLGAEDEESEPRAVLAERVLEGWVLVPREPTIEMLVAANAAWFIPDPSPFNKGDEARREVWKAMLAAAPQPGEPNITQEAQSNG